MSKVTYAGFKIKGISDGTLYRARVERGDNAPLRVNGQTTQVWETSQSMDEQTAIGQAIYLIDTGRIK
ncbi:MAG TPA: hypothetical protein VNW15_00145 [Rhizomicrobium sp.]|jgi:hypothetical protein|nr:hypothetical protein [Rhizomicrobium sp.]